MRFLAITFGFTFANFLWQGFCREPDWMRAFERSYFQAMALLYIWAFGVQP